MLLSRNGRSFISKMMIMVMLITMFGFNPPAAYVYAAGPASAGESAKPTLSDLTESYAAKEIQALIDAGIVSGFEDGTFRPKDPMTRAQLAKMISLSMGLKEDPKAAERFTDVPEDAWYRGFVGALIKSSITDGTSAATFSPEEQVTREQLAVFFIRAFGLEEQAKKAVQDAKLSDLASVSVWAKAHVSFAFKIGFLQGIGNGDGTVRFEPSASAERQALARLAYEFNFNGKTFAERAKELAGPDKAEQLKEAVKAANEAISALPAASSLKKEHQGQIETARAKVDAAKKLGAADKDFPGLSKLEDAEKKLKELLAPPPVFGGGGGIPAPVTPAVTSAAAVDNSTIEVTFNTSLSSANKDDFTFDNGLTVVSAALKAGNSSIVVLKTSVQEYKTVYTLSYKGSGTGKTVTGTYTVLEAIADGDILTGVFYVKKGVAVFGPATGTAVINGTLLVDPGFDKELDLQNIDATRIEVLSGASNSIKFKSKMKVKVLVVAASGQAHSVRVETSSETVVEQTNVESGAILSSGAGSSFGGISIGGGAAGQSVSLFGAISTNVNVTQSATGASITVGANASVSAIILNTGASVTSIGVVSEVAVTASASNQQVTIAGSFSAISVGGQGAQVNFAQNTTVSMLSVTAPGTRVNVPQSTTISTVQLSSSTTIVANGNVLSIEMEIEVEVVIEGAQKDPTIQKAIEAAIKAIAELRPLDQMTLIRDEGPVKAARRKVTAALKLDSAANISNIAGLQAAEARIAELVGIKNAAVQDAIQAIAALPDIVSLVQGPDVAAVRALVTYASSIGAKVSEITNLTKLEAAESKLEQLQQDKQRAIRDAINSINALPANITIEHKAQVEAARLLVNSARAKGAIDSDITNLSVLAAAEAKIPELAEAKRKAVEAAVNAIAALPAGASPSIKAQLEAARALVEAAKVRGALDADITNLAKLAGLEADMPRATVEAAMAELLVGYANGDSADSVTQNVALPAAGSYGTTVKWASSNSAFLSAAGNVMRPGIGQKDASVTLTATVSFNGYSSAKTFVLKVKAQTPLLPSGIAVSTSDTDLIRIGGVRNVITWTDSTTPAVTGYQVARGTTDNANDATVSNADIAVGTQTFTDITAVPGTAYYYFVYAKAGGAVFASPGVRIVTAADISRPIVSSASATINGTEVPADVSENTITFTLDRKLPDNAMITKFQIAASADVTEMSVTNPLNNSVKTNPFVNGVANLLVSDLLGPLDPQGDGVSVGIVRGVIDETTAREYVLSGSTLKNSAGSTSEVTIKLKAATPYVGTAIQAANAAIAAIPSMVTLADEATVTDARAKVNAALALEADASDFPNLGKLEAAEAAIKVFVDAANAVKAEIAALPVKESVTLANQQTVATARANYDALSPEQKSLVGDITRLTDAEAAIKALVNAANAVKAEIAALPVKESVTLANQQAVATARANYDVLSTEQKSLVGDISRLTDAEAVIKSLVDTANAVKAEIAALPVKESVTLANQQAVTTARANYDALSAEQKSLVGDITRLADAEAVIQALVDAVNAVKAEIAALPVKESVTLANQQAVATARANYDALSTEQKSLVGDITRLTDAETVIKALVDAANAVKAEIAALPVKESVTLANQQAVATARTNYDALSADQKSLVGDITRLTDAESAIQALVNAANAVKIEIAALPVKESVTLANQQAVATARANYDALSTEQKSLVGDITRLTDAETVIKALVDAANAVKAEIASLPAKESVTLANQQTITTARANYDALLPEQKPLVGDITHLTDAEAAIQALVNAANAVKAEIAALPAKESVTLAQQQAVATARSNYDVLSTEQKALVGDITRLTEAEAVIQALVDAVNAVKAEIAALPVKESVTLANQQAVTTARTNYDALTPEQKPLVGDITRLTDAEAAIQALADAANAVKTEIAALPVKESVTLANQQAVATARTNYDALSTEQKSLVGDITRLTDAEEKISSLLAKLAAIDAANTAIASIPSTVTLADEAAITNARAKVDAAVTLGATSSDFPNVGKLEAAETTITNLKARAVAINAANTAIASIPSTVTLADEAAVTNARAKVDAAVALGATSGDFPNLGKLEAAETTITNLKARAAAIDAANTAIASIPSTVTLADEAAVTNARTKVDAAVTLGATSSDFPNLGKLEAAENTITSLKAKAAAIAAANTAIASIPSTVTLADEPSVLDARAKVNAAIALGATSSDFPNLAKLTDAEAAIAEIKAPPIFVSASAVINGMLLPAEAASNELRFILGLELKDTDMVTGFRIRASRDTTNLVVTFAGITKTIAFVNGEASMTVAQLLGSAFDPQGDGVSVGTLRQMLAEGNIHLQGTLADTVGNQSAVSLKLLKTVGTPPVLSGAAAIIDNQTYPASISGDNHIVFAISDTWNSSSMITGFNITSSMNAHKLTFTYANVTRSVFFENGAVQMAVKDLLGPLDPQGDGVSVGTLRSAVGEGNLTLSGFMTDLEGQTFNVAMTFIQTQDTGAPVVLSATAAVGTQYIPAMIGPNTNEITFVISRTLDSALKVTGFTLIASSDAYQLTAGASNVVRTIAFVNGKAQATVGQLLGSAFDPQGDGVSVGMLRQQLAGQTAIVSGMLSDHSGNRSPVTIKVQEAIEAEAPTLYTANAIIQGIAVPATIDAQHNVTFTVPYTMNDSDRFTGLLLSASTDAYELVMSEPSLGITRRVTFINGSANVSVSQLLGPLDPQADGVTVGQLRQLLTAQGMTVNGTLYDLSGNETPVKLILKKEGDLTAPAVSSLAPASGFFKLPILLTATASDNVGIASIKFEYSVDPVSGNWQQIAVIPASGRPKAVTLSHMWSLDGIPDGTYYVRAIATDESGLSNTGGPVMAYVIDRIAPARPSNVAAAGVPEGIQLSWQATEANNGYTVYRSSEENGVYTKLAGPYAMLSYTDSATELSTIHYYKVTATDAAGNESEPSDAVSAERLPDTFKPVIHSVNMPNNATLPANPTLSVLASDNYKLSELKAEYESENGWVEIGRKTNIGQPADTAGFVWNTASLSEKVYTVRFQASDYSGNTEERLFSYMLNVEAPAAPTVSATAGGWKVDLSWTSGGEPDLAGFRVWRSTTPGGSYQLIKETTGSTYTDERLSPSSEYYYVVDAIDSYRNTSHSAEVAVRPLAADPYAPTAHAGDDQTVIVGTEVQFDGTRSSDNDRIMSYSWDFGDGTTSDQSRPKHTYQAVGQYSATLTVRDPAGNQATDSVRITVREPLKVGTAVIQVISDEGGSPISGASVMIQYADGSSERGYTDGTGTARLVVSPGDYQVYVYKTDYKPASADISVGLNQSASATVRLKAGQVVVGDLNVKRMTLDEIQSAGIDTNAPENQWVYKFEVHLSFNNQPLPTAHSFIANYRGHFVGGAPAPFVIPVSGGGGGGSGGGRVETLIAYPVIIPHERPEVRPTVAYMVIPGEARWLKEFFEVGLSLENTADAQFALENSKAELHLPDGLALAPTRDPQQLQVDLGTIAGGEKRNVKWIIRGDEKGYYDLLATFTGVLKPFNDVVKTEFRTKEPFRVWGEDALRMYVDAQDRADAGHPYHVRFGFENVSDVPVYNLTLELKDDGTQNFIYAPNQILTQSVSELAPGTTQWFEYWLIPSISGNLDLSQSFVLRTGGNASIPASIMSHSMPGNYPGSAPVMRQQRGADQRITLTWDEVEGATGYKIYKFRNDKKMSGAEELVYTAAPGTNAITLDGLDEMIHYVIATITAIGELLRHVQPWFGLEQTAMPEVTGTVHDESSTIVGTAEPNAKITLRYAQQAYETYADSQGAFAATIPSNWDLQAGDTLRVTAKSDGKTESDAATVIVSQAPLTPKPAVNEPVDQEMSLITGTTEPGSTITVKDAGGNVLGTTIGSSGSYQVNLNRPLSIGEVLTVTAKLAGYSLSETVHVAVRQAPLTERPTIDQAVNHETTFITGTTEPASTVTVKDAEGRIIGSNNGYTYSTNKYQIVFNRKLVIGETIQFTAKLSGKSVSEVVDVTVAEAPQTSQPTVNETVTDETTNMTGTTEPNSTVYVTDANGQQLGSNNGHTYSTNSYQILFNRALTVGEVLAITAKLEGKTVSEAVYVTVQEAPRALQPTVDQVINYETTFITGTKEWDSAVTVKDAQGVILGQSYYYYEYYRVDLNRKLQLGEVVTVTAKSPTKNESLPITLTVGEAPQTTPPTVNQTITDETTYITGTAEHNSTVTAKDAEGQLLGTGYTYSYSSYELYFSRRLTIGEIVTITAKAEGKTVSDSVYSTVVDGILTTTPALSWTVYDETTFVYGTTDPYSNVVAKDEAGLTVATAYTYYSGDFYLSFTRKLLVGEKITIVAKADQKADSQALVVEVQPAPVTKAPTVADSVYVDSTYVKVMAPSDAKVAVETEAGQSIETKYGYDWTNYQGDHLNYPDVEYLFWLSSEVLRSTGVLKITAKSYHKAVSETVYAPVLPLGSTAAPSVTRAVYEDSRYLYGLATPGASVYVKQQDGTTMANGIADPNGRFAAELNNVYWEDFESTDGGFAAAGNRSSWQWGEPVNGPMSAVSGRKVWGTNLSGPYNNFENSSITSREIDLRSADVESVTLSWSQWLVTESGYDRIYVQVSKDGGVNWADAIGSQPGSVSSAWTRKSVQLDSSYAVPNFKLRFVLVTDISVVYAGFYVDDIVIVLQRSGAGLTAGQQLFVSAKAPHSTVSESVYTTVQPVNGKTSVPVVDGDIVEKPGSANPILVYGTAESESIVRVEMADGKWRETIAGMSGEFGLSLPAVWELKAGDVLLFTADAEGKTVSDTVQVRVKEAARTAQPTVTGTVYEQNGEYTVYDLGASLAGTAEPGAAVRVSTVENGQLSRWAYDGTYSISIPYWWVLRSGDELEVTAQSENKAASQPVIVKVEALQGPTSAPTVTGSVYKTTEYADLFVTGTTEPNAIVAVRYPYGGVDYTQADDNGNYTMYLYWYGLNVGDTLEIFAHRYGKSPSHSVTVPVVQAPLTPQPSVIGAVYEQSGDGTWGWEFENRLSGQVDLGARVKLESPVYGYLTADAQSSGSYTVYVPAHWRLAPGDILYVSALRSGYSASEPVPITVQPNQGQTAPPTVTGSVYKPTDYYSSMTVMGTAAPGAIVKVTFPNGYQTSKADEAGKYMITLYGGYASVGDILEVAAKTPGQAGSFSITVVVMPPPPTEVPVVTSTLYEQDGQSYGISAVLEGTAEKDSLINVSFEGSAIGSGDASNGMFNASIYPWIVLVPGNVLEVTAQAPGKSRSAALRITVSANQGMSTAPTVTSSVYEQNGSYTGFLQQLDGTGEGGSWVEVEGYGSMTGGWVYQGNFSVQIPDYWILNAGERLKVTAKLYGKTVSEAVYVPVIANQGVTGAPAVTGAFYAGDMLKGTAEPSSAITVESDTWGVYRAVAPPTGQFAFYLPSYWSLVAGEVLTIRAQAPGKGASDPVTITVAIPQGKTAEPVVSGPVYHMGWIEGTAEPGASITVNGPYGESITRTANSGGNFNFPLPDYWNLQDGQQIIVTARVSGKEASNPVSFTVAPWQGVTETPGVKQPYYLGDSLSVTMEAGSMVTVRAFTQGNQWNTLTSPASPGRIGATIRFPDSWVLNAGDTIQVTATALGKAPSEPVSITIMEPLGKTAIPVISTQVYNSGWFEVTAEPGARVTASILDGGKSYVTYTNNSGSARIIIPRDWSIAAGDTITVTAKMDGKSTSDGVTASAAEAATTTGLPTVEGGVYIGSSRIEGKAEPGSTVQAARGTSLYNSIAGEDGTFSLIFPANRLLEENETITLYAAAFGKRWSDGLVVQVTAAASKTAVPVSANGVYDGILWVKGTAEPFATVEVTRAAGSKLSLKARADGTFSAVLPYWTLQEGETISVTAQLSGKRVSDPLLLPVQPSVGVTPTATVTQSVYAGASSISGISAPYAGVMVKVAGDFVAFGEAGPDGSFTVNMQSPLNPGTVELYARVYGMQMSEPALIGVSEASVSAPAPIPSPVFGGAVTAATVTESVYAGAQFQVSVYVLGPNDPVQGLTSGAFSAEGAELIGVAESAEPGKYAATLRIPNAGPATIRFTVNGIPSNTIQVEVIAVQNQSTGPSPGLVFLKLF